MPDNVDPEKLPPALASVVLRCIKNNPEERYFSADDLIKALDESLSAGPAKTAESAFVDDNICPSCGAVNGDEVKFCESCGAGMTRVCPECQRENSIHKQFCGGCGTDVEAFLKWQDVAARMEQYSKEKRWGRVLKEAEQLGTQEPRLRRKKGQELVQQVATLRQEAQAIENECAQLPQKVAQLLAAGKVDAAYGSAAHCAELDPHDKGIGALVEKLERARQEMEEAHTCRFKDNQQALALYRGVLELLPGYRPALELSEATESAVLKAGELQREAVAELEAKNPRRAFELWQEAVKLDQGGVDNNIGKQARERSGQLEGLIKAAQEALSSKRTRQAQKLIPEITKLEPEAPEVPLLQSGIEAFRRRRRLTARVAFAGVLVLLIGLGVYRAMLFVEERAAERERREKVVALISAAKEAHNVADWKTCLAKLDAVLLLEQDNSEAEALREKAVIECKAALERERQAKIANALTAAKGFKESGDWQKCFNKVEEVLKLEPGHIEALSLEKEALQHVASIIFEVVDEAGKAVAATISDGKGEWRSGVAFPIAVGQAYAFSITATAPPASPRGYESASLRLTADWRGPQTRRVVLKEVKGPIAGSNARIDDLGLELVWVASGRFQMGSNSGDNDEKPVRTVEITRGYWLGKTEVTQAQWRSIMGDNPSYFKGDNLPVEQVSWNQCVELCQKLTERERRAGRLPEGYVYRLPTEAEWEFAARGGTKSRGYRYSGGNDLDRVAWHSGNCEKKTHAVGTKAHNELGLHDMSGNVDEWCHDWYQDSYNGLANMDPSGPKDGSKRVQRGGSWNGVDSLCLVANRYRCYPSDTKFCPGFRLSLAPPVQ